MRALLSWPGPGNPGDTVILEGVKSLLKEAIPGVEFDDIPGWEKPPARISTNSDYLVFCGSPWLWDGFQNTRKFANAAALKARAIEINPATRVLWLGIGDALLADENGHPVVPGAMQREAEQAGMRELFGGSALVVARSENSAQWLCEAKVPAICLPCPAFFAYGKPPQPRAVVFFDPINGLAASAWAVGSERRRLYIKAQADMAKEWGCDVFCCIKADADTAAGLGLKAQLMPGARDISEAMGGRSLVLSGRAHPAVVARVLGADACLLATDSRAAMAGAFGVGIAWTPGEARNWLARRDHQAQRAEWVRIIREALR